MSLISFSSVFAVPTTWNIHPNDPSIIQIKDENKSVIGVQILKGDASGFKTLEIEGKTYHLPKLDEIAPANVFSNEGRPSNAASAASQALGKRLAPSDGFAPEPFRTGARPTNYYIDVSVPTSNYVYIDRRELALKYAGCWRVSPTNPGYYDLLDPEGFVLYSDRIQNNGELRKLYSRSLRINASRYHYFLRHPDDGANLEAHGFVKGVVANVYRLVAVSAEKRVLLAKVRKAIYDARVFEEARKVEREAEIRRVAKRKEVAKREAAERKEAHKEARNAARARFNLSKKAHRDSVRAAKAVEKAAAREAECRKIKSSRWKVDPQSNNETGYRVQILDENDKEFLCVNIRNCRKNPDPNGCIRVKIKGKFYNLLRARNDNFDLKEAGFLCVKKFKYSPDDSSMESEVSDTSSSASQSPQAVRIEGEHEIQVKSLTSVSLDNIDKMLEESDSDSDFEEDVLMIDESYPS